jgi:hypothetical protein
MQPLIDRRKRELSLKLQSLEKELEAWETRTTQPPLRRHFSQVRRLKATLEGLLDSMSASAAWKNPTDEIVLQKASVWERRILTAHAIWEVFRGKIAQRDDERFRAQLMACDDLAWACYEPAMVKFSTARREPPLVYLNSTWSAFLRKRNVPFEKDVQAGKDARDVLDEDDYVGTLKQLPIPLLGLPWFQVAHLPSTMIIAHEIGHAVEFDFDLTSKIAAALDNAGLAFTDDWKGAASEVFADLYGCLCLGEHFANALLDLLVAGKSFVAAETDFDFYPTRAHRVELTAKALEHLGLGNAAAQIRSTWEEAYGPLAPLLSRGKDVQKVVEAFYGTPGIDLASVIKPPTEDIEALAQAAGYGNRTALEVRGDARTFFCALRYVYDNQDESEFPVASEVIVDRVLEGYADVFRFRGTPVKTQEEVEKQVEAMKAEDVEAGKRLAKRLGLEDDNAG